MDISDKKSILVTGFEPFGGESINPSWEAVSGLPEIIDEYYIHRLKLPVVYNGAAEAAIQYSESVRSSAVLAIGQAGGREGITPEMTAVNIRYSEIPDNCGNIFHDTPVNPEGKNAYFTTLPVREISRAIRDKGFPSHVSYSAGTFVCNDLMYSLLHYYNDTDIRCGFIHVPYIPEQNHPDKPFMTLDDIISSIETAIETIILNL